MSTTSSERSYETVRVEHDRAVATIVLDRPQARNALSMQLKSDLAQAIAAVRDDDRVRTVILTGEGPAFCAGGDIKEMASGRPAYEYRSRLLTVLESIAIPLARMPKPVIAAINGHAHGAGVSLALDAGGGITEAYVSLGAVAPTTLLVAEAGAALVGSSLDAASLARLDAAAEFEAAVRAACTPISDKRGTVEYRTHVAGVLAKRAAKIAYDRAKVRS